MSGDLAGRAFLVTGASSGLGREIARGLGRRSATVVLHGRDLERGEAALRAVREESPQAVAELVVADLADQSEVRGLAATVARRHPALHGLVNNAATVRGEPGESPQGVECTFAVNHLAPFLLTRLLLPALVAAAPARVVTVGSAAHRSARLDLDQLDGAGRRPFSGWRAYKATKLANLLFTRALARRLDGGGVSASCLDPGVIATRFGHSVTGDERLRTRLLDQQRGDPGPAARTGVELVAGPGFADANGAYITRGRVTRPAPVARDDELAERLWRRSEELTGLAPSS